MALTATEVTKLKQLIRLASDLLESAVSADRDDVSVVSFKRQGKSAARKKQQAQPIEKRQRRSGKELVAFRKMLKSERKKGVPVAELAEKHGISTAYIYSLR